jgi:hypothetical protein
MIPSKLDITIYRGVTFERELISQVKTYAYDTAVHNLLVDKKRTHAENLKFYGFVYEYVDFLALYPIAELIINKPWVKAGQTSEPLDVFTLASGDLELTTMSVKMGIPAAATKLIEYNEATYELLLTTADGIIDGLVYGNVTVMGEM